MWFEDYSTEIENVTMYSVISQAIPQYDKCYCINESSVGLRWVVVLEKNGVTQSFLGIFTACTRQQWISNQHSYLIELL